MARRHRSGILVALVALSGILAFAQPQKNPLTNADVVQMVQNGFQESVVLDAIQANDCQFDVGAQALIQLKNAGVSQTIISAMLNAETRRHQQQNVPGAQRPEEARQSPVGELHAYIIQDKSEVELPITYPQIIQTKVKGKSVEAGNLDTLANDSAVDAALVSAATSSLGLAAYSAAVSSGSWGGVYGAGIGVAALSGWLQRRNRPVVTDLWALPGHSAATVVGARTPAFFVVYDNVPGVNPDEYQPALVKLAQTPNNWRLLGATKAADNPYEAWPIYSNLVEARIPVQAKSLGRGRIQIEASQPLDAAEYAVVLRPASPDKVISGTDVMSNQREGLMFNSVWTFAVGEKTSIPEVNRFRTANYSAYEDQPKAAGTAAEGTGNRPAVPNEQERPASQSGTSALPLTLQEVEKMLADLPKPRVLALVGKYGVDFTLTSGVQQRLRSLGADSDVLLAIAQGKK
jgi:hypothetical protein